ncbi:unnamed protein product [Ilex paraguariensis]|uniref:Uncharacterized protein n=1 Tax=Ilex paraguariensis TaxID=185542 RepID=A0ABC8RQV7_9AQUA
MDGDSLSPLLLFDRKKHKIIEERERQSEIPSSYSHFMQQRRKRLGKRWRRERVKKRKMGAYLICASKHLKKGRFLESTCCSSTGRNTRSLKQGRGRVRLFRPTHILCSREEREWGKDGEEKE